MDEVVELVLIVVDAETEPFDTALDDVEMVDVVLERDTEEVAEIGLLDAALDVAMVDVMLERDTEEVEAVADAFADRLDVEATYAVNEDDRLPTDFDELLAVRVEVLFEAPAVDVLLTDPDEVVLEALLVGVLLIDPDEVVLEALCVDEELR
ncbi:hypothetical protein LTR28_010900, partial [Elasticomyces elasticus]